MVGGFTSNDGTIDFYLRINALINADSIVLDLGAGRAGWFEDDKCETRKRIRNLRGKVKELIAADVDEVVLNNRASDRQIVITDGIMDVEPASVDLIIANYVLEHVEKPKEFYEQVNSCLKRGGWFCARTPHKYTYVSIMASLIKNSRHSKFLKFIQPTRKKEDVFPTFYRMNRIKDIQDIFQTWENKSFIYRAEPSYFFGNRFIYQLQSALHRILPAFMYGGLFIFVRKP